MIQDYNEVAERYGCSQMMEINPDEDLRRWSVQQTITLLANADYYYTKKEVDDIIQGIEISGGTTPEQVQEMIDEAISGKADTTAVTEAISEATSGKVDTSTYTAYTAATNSALNNKQNELTAGDSITIDYNTINTKYRGLANYQSYYYGRNPFYVVAGYDCGGSSDGEARFAFEDENHNMQEVRIHFDSSYGDWHCDSWEDPQICDELWKYFDIYWDSDKNAFYVQPFVDVDASDDYCTRFTENIQYAGTTTDALDGVFSNLGGLKFVSLTQNEYDNLHNKDANTIYFIK